MVKIMIDSASDMTQKEADALGMILVPIEVQIDGELYMDGVDLSSSEFYDKLVQAKELPHTSLINEYRWHEAFEKATANGDDVVVIVLSSKLSGTLKCAQDAAKDFEGKVYVVDSLSATLSERLLGEYALRLSKEGLGAKEIAEKLEAKKGKLHAYAMIDTLKYLKMGGRISATTAFFGELLGIKPIIGLVDGKVEVIGKEKGAKKASIALKKIVEKDGGIDLSLPHGILWTGNDTTLRDKFIEDYNELWNGDLEIQKHMMSSTVGTHVGPGGFGLAYFENE